jgi:outer membrane lipoprotein-sorting protein
MQQAVLGADSPRPSAQEVVSNLDKTFQGIDDYACLADAHYRKGYLREDKIYKIYFKKPHMVRIEVREGSGSGSVAVLTKEKKVKGHRGGWLSWLILHPDIDSPLVKTIRGHRLDQSHFGNMIEKLKLAVENESVSARLGSLDGSEYYVLEVNREVPSDGVTRGIVYIHPKRWLIKKILEYEGDVEVVNVTYSEISTNVGLSDSIFDL